MTIIEEMAEAIYKKDYPKGGSVYKDWQSIPMHDKELYRADAKAAWGVVQAYHDALIELRDTTPITAQRKFIDAKLTAIEAIIAGDKVGK